MFALIFIILLASAVRQEKKNRSHPDCKRSKTLFLDNMSIDTETPVEPTKRLVELSLTML